MGGYLSLLVPEGGSREKFFSLSASSQHCRQLFDLRHSDKIRTDSSPLLSSSSCTSLSFIFVVVVYIPLSFPASHSGISSIIDLAIVHQPHTLTSHYTRIFISQDSRLIHTTQTQNDLTFFLLHVLYLLMAWHGMVLFMTFFTRFELPSSLLTHSKIPPLSSPTLYTFFV